MQSYIWSEVQIPESVIQRVHKISIQEEQPIFLNGELRYEWNNGVIKNESDVEIPEENENDV